MKKVIYGYCRVSTKKQDLQRQIDNIKREYPEAIIVTEKYTGTTVDRPEWNKLRKRLHAGDTVVFDEVSRMSRNADEGVKLYEELFAQGVNLAFLKERHIDTDVYKQAISQSFSMTGEEIADCYIEATNKVLQILARRQVEIAFSASQWEVDSKRQNIREGIYQRKLKGLPVGRTEGAKYETKKSKAAKEVILECSKDFNGTKDDTWVIDKTGLARNTYYKYKRELKQEVSD